MKLLLFIDARDINHVKSIRGLGQFSQVIVRGEQVDNGVVLASLIAKLGIDCIATTRFSMMKRADATLEGTAADNYGYAVRAPFTSGKPMLFLPPLEQVRTVNEANFLFARFLRKLHKPDSFILLPKLHWQAAHGPDNESIAYDAYQLFQKAKIISIDIETKKDPLLITSVSYTAWFGGDDAKTIVFPVNGDNCEWAYSWLGKFNALPAPKLFQNGQYDNAWFLRFNVPVHNWLYDTYTLQHCMFPELPKRLAYMALMYLRGVRFWKDENATNALEYNAKDTHITLFVFLAMMAEAEQYALNNYVIEFKLNFPMLHSGLEGILVDKEKRAELRAIELKKKESSQAELQALLGLPTFNPGSPQQMLRLMHALGHTSAKGTDKIEMQRFAENNVLYDYIATLTKKYRKSSKAISTYYDMSLCGGRLIYKIDPAGTETGRAASQESPYWTGTQIQNIPGYCKEMFIADQGWELSEVDNAQSESRCTAYISRDPALIDAVENSPDFHCKNASLFFGIPFELLFDIATGKVLRKDIRTLAKRTNHGANYNMGPDVLVETMGTAAVLAAGRMLNLPAAWSARRIAEHLLQCFHKAYPMISGNMYREVTDEVRMTGKFAGATGWVRRTFLDPAKGKLHVNAIVAHHPQSLSVMLVNKAYYLVWRDLQLASKSRKLRLKAQIHDSIFFQYPKGGEAVVEEVSKIMKIPCVVHGQTMVIPNDPKFGAHRWADLKD